MLIGFASIPSEAESKNRIPSIWSTFKGEKKLTQEGCFANKYRILSS